MKANIFKIGSLIILTILLSGCSINIFGQKSGIQITSNPQANVTLNGQAMGNTPVYQENNKPGTYVVRLSSTDMTLQPWEGKVNLVAGTITIVDRQLGATTDQSHGYTLSFEKLSNKTSTEVNVISLPNTSSVLIDGSPSGFTPLTSNAVIPGPHTFTLTAPGYQDKVIKASVQAGYRLVINAQMAVQVIAPNPTPTATPSASPTPTKSPVKTPTVTTLPKQASSSATVMSKPYVEILTTPTGWLKVREQASISSAELAKVNPGDKFHYQEASAAGWLKIEYTAGEYGFVSTQYSKLVK